MTPLVDVLTKSTDYLRQRGVASPRLDAELLIGHALGLDRVKVYLNFDRPLGDEELAAIRGLVRRRGNREPLAWCTGKKSFGEHDFCVDVGVLVPRPDTETLVAVALAHIPTETPAFVADIGCGSGCIGLSVATARPGVLLYACDLSDAALACTRRNVEALGLKERVGVLKGDLLAAIPASRPVDWVLSNPPYIPRADIDALEPEVRTHEPRLALDGGGDGLDLYRRLVPQSAARARQGVAVEVGAGQAPAVAELFALAGLVEVRCHPDLAGIERVVSGVRGG